MVITGARPAPAPVALTTTCRGREPVGTSPPGVEALGSTQREPSTPLFLPKATSLMARSEDPSGASRHIPGTSRGGRGEITGEVMGPRGDIRGLRHLRRASQTCVPKASLGEPLNAVLGGSCGEWPALQGPFVQGRGPLSPEDLRPSDLSLHHRHSQCSPELWAHPTAPTSWPVCSLKEAVQEQRTVSSRMKEQWELGWTWTEGGLPKVSQTPCREPGLSLSAGARWAHHAKGARTHFPKPSATRARSDHPQAFASPTLSPGQKMGEEKSEQGRL